MSYQTANPFWLPSDCYDSSQNGRVGICIHHAASTNFWGIASTLQDRGLSTHWGCGQGVVQQYCDENVKTWHCGNDWGNSNLISIETVNSGDGDQGWPVSEEVVSTLCELIADIADRLELDTLQNKVNVWGHKDFYNTFCPGVLYDRIDEICARAQNIRDGVEDDMPNPGDLWNYGIGQDATPGKSNLPAWMRLSWMHHDTAALYAALCSPHDNVANGQKSVTLLNQIDYMDDRILTMTTQVAALTEAVKTLATSQGADPDAISQKVADAVKAKLESLKISAE